MAPPDLLTAALSGASNSQLARALLMLERAAAGRAEVATAARAALDEQLPELVRRLGDSEGNDTELLAAVRLATGSMRPLAGAVTAMDELPGGSGAPGLLAAEITALAVEALAAGAEHDCSLRQALALALSNLSKRLSELGRNADALVAGQEAVTHFHALAEDEGDEHRSGLAMALNNLSNRLGELGRLAEAHAASQEAVDHYRLLAEADPQRYGPDLATALNTLSNRLGEHGRSDEALVFSEESVRLFRASSSSDEHLSGLADSLNNLSIRLSDLGRISGALLVGEEAVAAYRLLADGERDRYVPDLAMSLSNLSEWLGEVGRSGEALVAAEESVDRYRALVEVNSDRFLPALATALNNLSNRLWEAGRHREALTASDEAVNYYRLLAEASRDRFLPSLAAGLNNLSNRFAELGQPRQALAAGEEAVAHCRSLAETDPDRFLAALAMALTTMANALDDVGRQAEALAVSEEAVGHYRILVHANPDRHLPDLAMSLHNLSTRLSESGRLVEALAGAQEAIDRYRALVAVDPGRHLPDLAMSLHNLSIRLSESGRLTEALATAEEAVGHYAKLAETHPDRHRPTLAAALNNLSNRLADSGRTTEALTIAERALTSRRSLAATYLDRYLPDLATSLTNLSIRLTDEGRGAAAERLFSEILAEYAEASWAMGVLLLSRARWRAYRGDLALAVGDAWSAALRLADDVRRRSEARLLLRSLRAAEPTAFDQVWDRAVGDEWPVWLWYLEEDADLNQVLMAWISAPTWQESEIVLRAHADAILTARAEAALEHLIDANPGLEELRHHLALLQSARTLGVTGAYTELRRSLRRATVTQLLVDWADIPTWEASRRFLVEHTTDLLTEHATEVLHGLVNEHPDDVRLLAHLGLLATCRTDGLGDAYVLLGDPASLRAATQRPPTDDPLRTLATARLVAGLHPEDGDAQLSHALAALLAGEDEEAVRAVARCAEASNSWERQGRADRLTGLAADRPELGQQIGRLRTLLIHPPVVST